MLYREGDLVYLQNQMLFPEQLAKALDSRSITKLVGPRKVVTEEGERISEWQTTIADVLHFRAIAKRNSRSHAP